MKHGKSLYIRVDFCDFTKQGKEYRPFGSQFDKGSYQLDTLQTIYKRHIIKINTYHNIIEQMVTMVHEVVHFIFKYYQHIYVNKHPIEECKIESGGGGIIRLPKGLKEESVCLKIDRYAREIFVKYFIKRG